MNRDDAVFPQDDNGEALWHACQRGITLGDEHSVRFAVVFPRADAALKFGVFLLRHGYWVKVDEIDDRPGYEAEVLLKM